MKSNNIIEINGRRYDARTGLPVDKKQPVKKAVTAAGTFIDGYRRQPKATQPAAAASVGNTAKKPVASRTASQHVSHKAKQSTTLNRSVVKKPVVATKQEATAAAQVQTPKSFDQSRFKRASEVVKSSAISKFHTSEAQKTATHKSAHSKNDAAVAPKQAETSKKEQLISEALAAANSHVKHEQSKKTRKPHKFGRYATTAAVTLLLLGYITYLNVPSISMKVAARRAGFAATMPGYRPSGYSLNGPISYSAGQVVVGFRSNTDGRNFSLTQQPTNWDSTALVENYVTKQSPNYLTYQDSGLTVYIFNGSSAAWVNNGKLYSVDGKNSELDSDQLLKLATSV